MKTLLIVVVIAFLATHTWAISDKLKEMLEGNEHTPHCMTEAKVDESTLTKAMENNFKGSDEKTKCFVKCIMEKNGLFQDGELHLENVKLHLLKTHPVEKVDIIIKNCKEVIGQNACDKAFNAVICHEVNVN